MFYSIVPPSLALEAKRLDGVHQTERMIYSPFYSNLSQITPESVQILEAHTLSSGLAQTPSLQSGIGIEHDFPHHWHVQSNLYTGESWKGVRSRNINAPLVASQQSLTLAQALAAPRPLIANQNIFRTEDTGHLSGHAFFIALDQHSYKTFSFFLGYLNFNFHNDTAGSEGFAQSAYSNQGESGRPDWQTSQRVFLYGMLKLPKSLALSGMLDASSGQPWNAITGSDNNGDGVFNDRPSWDNGTDANSYHTAFGRMSIDKTNGTAPRNIGTLPAQYHLNLNLSRSWTLEHGMRGHPWTTTLNLRGTNIGNHTNVTGVSTVASSPEFAQPTSAESARRTEFGVRVSF